MAAAPEQQRGGERRKPGWMSIPGGPQEPNLQQHRAKFQSLVDQKKKCFEELSAIRAEFDAARGDTGEKTETQKEREMLQKQMAKINTDRRKELDSRREADARIKAVRQERRTVEKQLDDLTQEVGAFSDVSEIDEAIDLVMYKLETGTSSLAAEKACIKRLAKLEEAKGLLQKLEPLEEAIADAEERELDLQQESRDIHARIAALNADYQDNLQAKIKKDEERKKNTFDFSALHKRRDAVKEKIDALNNEIDELQSKFTKDKKAWEEWREVAKEKFAAKIKAEREERERAWREREAARKLERRRAKAAKKLNPHAIEIEICSTLTNYLEQKVKIHKREVEEAEKRKKLASFDPAAYAPQGAALAGGNRDETWLFSDRTKKGSKQQKSKQPSANDKKGQAATEVSKDSKKKQVHHTADKLKQFEQVNVEAPLTYGAVDQAIEQLKKQKKEFESKIVVNPDDVEVSDSEEEQEETGKEPADDETQVASTTAPTAA